MCSLLLSSKLLAIYHLMISHVFEQCIMVQNALHTVSSLVRYSQSNIQMWPVCECRHTLPAKTTWSSTINHLKYAAASHLRRNCTVICNSANLTKHPNCNIRHCTLQFVREMLILTYLWINTRATASWMQQTYLCMQLYWCLSWWTHSSWRVKPCKLTCTKSHMTCLSQYSGSVEKQAYQVQDMEMLHSIYRV